MKKYMPVLFVFTLFIILLGFNVAHAEVICPNGNTLASNCTTAPAVYSEVLCPNGMTLASNCTSANASEVANNSQNDSFAVAQFNNLFKSSFKVGVKGQEVKALQQLLKDEGYYFGKVDGKYGKITERAVRDFKDDNDISTVAVAAPSLFPNSMVIPSATDLISTSTPAASTSTSASDASANISITDISYTFAKDPICGQKGDVNGDGVISKADYDFVRLISLNTLRATYPNMTDEEVAIAISAADVNGMNGVTSTDNLLIANYLTGKASSFSGCVFVSKYVPLACSSAKGDVNLDGKINNSDIGLARSQSLGKFQLDTIPFANADVNNDGSVTTLDISLIRRYLLGLDSTFPGCTVTNAQPSITVLSPNGGESWVAGSQHSISYSTNYNGQSTWEIGLLSSTNGVYTQIASSVNYTFGNILWTIPSNIQGGNYQIVIYIGTRDSYVAKVASNSFTITAPVVSSSISGVCAVRGNVNIPTSISASDIGTGYAKMSKTGVNTISGLQAACTQSDYASLLTSYCASNSNSIQQEVWTYDQNGNFHSSSCGAFGCDPAVCPTVSTIPAGAKQLVCGTLGDVNNDGYISSADSEKIRTFVLGTATPVINDQINEQQRSDTNGSGTITTSDISYITAYLAGTRTTFPGCSAN